MRIGNRTYNKGYLTLCGAAARETTARTTRAARPRNVVRFVAPCLRREGRECVQGAGFIAFDFGAALKIGGDELPARRGTARVDRAAGVFTDLADERDTTRGNAACAFHETTELVDVFGEFNGDSSRRYIVGLLPVERAAECGAACPAAKTGIVFHALWETVHSRDPFYRAAYPKHSRNRWNRKHMIVHDRLLP